MLTLGNVCISCSVRKSTDVVLRTHTAKREIERQFDLTNHDWLHGALRSNITTAYQDVRIPHIDSASRFVNVLVLEEGFALGSKVNSEIRRQVEGLLLHRLSTNRGI